MKALLLLLIGLLSLNVNAKNIQRPPHVDSLCSNAITGIIKTRCACDRHHSFIDKTFACDAQFSNLVFPSRAWFNKSIFEGDIQFINSTFTDFVDFSDVEFDRDATFSSCTFHKFLFMPHVRTDSTTVFYFYKSKLPDLIDFSQNQDLRVSVDFTDANFDSIPRAKGFYSDTRIFINIYKSAMSKLKLDYLHFRLCFYDPAHEDLVVDSLVKKLRGQTAFRGADSNTAITNYLLTSSQYKEYISVIFPSTKMCDADIRNFTEFYVNRGSSFPSRLPEEDIKALYSCLLKNFDSNGQAESYDSLNADYQDYVWNNRNFLLRWLHVFPKYWNYYGRHTEWIIGWTLLFLVVFTLINFFRYNVLFGAKDKSDNAYYLEKVPEISQQQKYANLEKLKYAFIYTSLIFFSFSIKIENVNYVRRSFFYIALISVTGLICLGYLANFILQK